MFIYGLMMLSVFAASFYPFKHALHMFQQNRYEMKRYVKWIKENIAMGLVKSIVPLGISFVALILVFTRAPWYIFFVLGVLMCGYTWAIEKGTSYIKPLVYTARVKRQCVTMYVLWFALVIGCFCLFESKANGILVFLSYFVSWLLVFLMAMINTPIEHMFQRKFLNEAKQILTNHNRLIKIGITGSYGKTTTKNIVQTMLMEQYYSHMTPASYNTPMGISKTVREDLKPIHQAFVCEMGADKVGDISELMELVHPSFGIVTSIGPQHLNTFGTQENIIREKMQMIERLEKDGVGILNYDNDFIRNYKIKNNVKIITYAIDHKADYQAVNITYSAEGSTFTLLHQDETKQLSTKLLGKLNILNILAAVALARELGISWQKIEHAVRTMPQVEHRLQLKTINHRHFIDDAFNANPVGSKMALEVLGMMAQRRIVVTPGMIDLGREQYAVNKTFGTYMKGNVDVVVLVGENQTKPIYEGLKESGFDMENVIVVATVKDAFDYIYANTQPSDTILLENDLPDAFNH